MTPDEAAAVIQGAWRERKVLFLREYEEELNATYYSMCYTPGMWNVVNKSNSKWTSHVHVEDDIMLLKIT